MTNVKKTIKDSKLVLEIDLDEEHGKSASGKTTTIGTSHGFQWFEYKDKTIGFSINISKR